MLGYGDDSAGMDAVNSFCQAHGYTSTFMGRLLLQDNTYGDNYTSVSDCGHFLKEIYQSNAGTTDTTLSHTDAMYSLLKMQERRNKIPANLPEGVKVANKTGELTGVETMPESYTALQKALIWSFALCHRILLIPVQPRHLLHKMQGLSMVITMNKL